MDSGDGGFSAADTWRNDISGAGGLVKQGSGALSLAGDNSYAGGTELQSGALVAASATALGDGGVLVGAGTLRIEPEAGQVKVRGAYTQSADGVLEVTLGNDGEPVLDVLRPVTLEEGCVLELHLDLTSPPAEGETIPVIRGRRVRGEFGAVNLNIELEGYQAAGASIAEPLLVGGEEGQAVVGATCFSAHVRA